MALPRFCQRKDSTGSMNLSDKTSIYSSIGSVASRRPLKPKHLKVFVPQLEDNESIGSTIEKPPLTGLRLQFEKLRRTSSSSLSISSLLRRVKVEKRKGTANTRSQSCVPISCPKTACGSQFPTIQHPHSDAELYAMPNQDDQDTGSLTASLNLFSFTQDRRGSCSGGVDLTNKGRIELNDRAARRISHQRTKTETQLTLKRTSTSCDRKSTRHKFRAHSYSSFSFLDPKPIPNPPLTPGVLEITLQASSNPLYFNRDLQTIPSASLLTPEPPVDDHDNEDDDDRSSFCTVSDRQSVLEYEPYCFPTWPQNA